MAHQKQETKEGLPAENGELREESPAPDEAGEKGATAAGRYTPSLRGPCLTSWEMRRNSYQLFCKHRVKKKKAVLETFLRRESHHIQSFKGQFFFFFFEWWIICCCLFFDTTWNSRILNAGHVDCLGCQLNVPRRGVLFISYYIQHTKWQLGSPRCALNMPLTFKIISVLILFSVKSFPQENNFLILALPVRTACSL